MSARRLAILSLGNPGPMNRHLAGHYVLHKLALEFNIDMANHSLSYISGANDSVTLVKSLTYMNESGKALRSFLRENLSPDQSLIILYDDFEVKLGRARLSPLKSPESHNGLSSCLRVLAGSNVDRDYVFKLGIGIGPKPKNANSLSMGAWVLSKFKQSELACLDGETLPLVADYLEFISDEEVKSVAQQTSRVNTIHSKKIQRGEYLK